MKKKIIYLTGFMAAGKSTIGPILANTLGWDFKDIDRVMEQKAGKKITQIFSDEGEIYFRELENNTL
ncbi:MAG: shikimate kinase, partial [Ignavibacteriaceae bacterium]|nr:shikimate kinase [Ignavibacteriaceae bacterium]